MGKAYGATELIFAEPIANALVNDSDFRSWVVRKTIFAEFAEDARLLHHPSFRARQRLPNSPGGALMGAQCPS
jgi:hypothetical protein